MSRHISAVLNMFYTCRRNMRFKNLKNWHYRHRAAEEAQILKAPLRYPSGRCHLGGIMVTGRRDFIFPIA